jgi:hypothetical protein
LVIPEEKDHEELALTLTGKKSNFNFDSFHDFGLAIGLKPKKIQNIAKKIFGQAGYLQSNH